VNAVFGLPVGIGPEVGLLDLVDHPVLDFKYQQAEMLAEENEVGLPALFPDSGLIPADKILVRPGRFPEETKDLPLALVGPSRPSKSSGCMRAMSIYFPEFKNVFGCIRSLSNYVPAYKLHPKAQRKGASSNKTRLSPIRSSISLPQAFSRS
jgi:hypothetical protein